MNGTLPEKIGRYEIKEVLGKGSMGVVYRAFDPVLEREVAIKTIESHFDADSGELSKFIERFKREAIAAGKLNHPNIITIHDFGFINETTPYIVMELIRGKTLKNYFEEGMRFDLEMIKNMVVQIASALEYAHKEGIVHRDIKPANIMILENFMVKIADFGIARLPQSELTKTGEILGTPNYMSPEQITGIPVDHRVDLFALGVILYQLLTGEKPFIGETFNSLAYRIVHEKALPPKTLNPSIPDSYNDITIKLLEKDRNLRPTVRDLLEALQSVSPAKEIDLSAKTIPSTKQIHSMPTQEVMLEDLSLWGKSLAYVQSHLGTFALLMSGILAVIIIISFQVNKKENTAPLSKSEPIASANEKHIKNDEPSKTIKEPEHGIIIRDKEEQPAPKKEAEPKINNIEETAKPPDESAIITVPNVRHDHGIQGGSCRGTLIFTEEFIKYTGSKHKKKWSYKYLRGIEMNENSNVLTVKTNEKQDYKLVKLFYFREYNFKLASSEMNEEIIQLLKKKKFM